MKYKVVRNEKYDFIDQSYGLDCYPNLHKYPATMLPQIGIQLLEEFHVTSGSMLDPYCGSGSSFASGLSYGFKDFDGFDLNPLAVAISKVKFSKIDLKLFENAVLQVKHKAYERLAVGLDDINVEKFNNFDYWFSDEIARKIQLLKNLILELRGCGLKDFFLLALSSTMRDCSFVRNNEFKLYRMKSEMILSFNPDVVGFFFNTLDKMIDTYRKYYFKNLEGISLNLENKVFRKNGKMYNVVLTSPPYGDSRTTVAYGQFSMFGNSWAFDVKNARSIDKYLMGGIPLKQIKLNSIIDSQISDIKKIDNKRAFDIASFYKDLGKSITEVSKSVDKNGYIFYVVGNRTVKNVNLRTDQFIAEQFENNGLKHLITYERIISNKRMPKLNSPTNKAGKKARTIDAEFIVVCQNSS